jgi:hypothetical protein
MINEIIKEAVEKYFEDREQRFLEILAPILGDRYGELLNLRAQFKEKPKGKKDKEIVDRIAQLFKDHDIVVCVVPNYACKLDGFSLMDHIILHEGKEIARI